MALWTFVSVDGLEPTNNLAAPGLRRAVLWRRRRFGTQPTAGNAFVARILTVMTSLRQQQHDVLDYLTAACEAAVCGDPPPSLLPLSYHPNGYMMVKHTSLNGVRQRLKDILTALGETGTSYFIPQRDRPEAVVIRCEDHDGLVEQA